MSHQPLSSLRPSEAGSVVRVEGPKVLQRRLVEMGFVPGVPVEVVGTAPLGDPLEVTLRGYRLAIRRTEAACVTVICGADSSVVNSALSATADDDRHLAGMDCSPGPLSESITPYMTSSYTH